MYRSRDAIILGAGLIAYNNLRPELGRATYVVANLSVGLLLMLIALRFMGSDLDELGIARGRSSVVFAAGAAAVAVAAPLFLLAANGATAHLVADDRVAGLDGSGLAFYALIRIPLGTALFEEFAFRGLLFGILSRRGPTFAAVASSAAFGLWHVRPAREVLQANAPDAGAMFVSLWVLASVLVTAAAGLAFCWLRRKGRAIWASVIFHATVNSLALLAAWVAHERLS